MTTLTANSVMSAGGGGAESLYQLKWTHYQNFMASGLHSLLEEGDFLTDVTLASEGQFIQAHKMALALCSPFFKEFFKRNRLERPNLQCMIVLGHIKFRELQNIVRFIYYGEVNVKQSELQAFLDAAQSLQIQGLENPVDTKSSVESTPASSNPVPSHSVQSHQTVSTRMATSSQNQQFAGGSGTLSTKRPRMSAPIASATATSCASSPISSAKISEPSFEFQGPSSSSLPEPHNSSYDPLSENLLQSQCDEGEEMISLEEVKPAVIQVSGWQTGAGIDESNYSQQHGESSAAANSIESHGATGSGGMFPAYVPPASLSQPPIDQSPGPSSSMSQTRSRPYSQGPPRASKAPGVSPMVQLPTKAIKGCYICKLRGSKKPTVSRSTCVKCQKHVCAKETCRVQTTGRSGVGPPICLPCSGIYLDIT